MATNIEKYVRPAGSEKYNSCEGYVLAELRETRARLKAVRVTYKMVAKELAQLQREVAEVQRVLKERSNFHDIPTLANKQLNFKAIYSDWDKDDYMIITDFLDKRILQADETETEEDEDA